MRKKEPCTLLGIWNVLPLEAWGWFAQETVDEVEKLTGVRIRVITRIQDDLNYECFVTRDVEDLKKIFHNMGHKKQLQFMRYLASDYRKNAQDFKVSYWV